MRILYDIPMLIFGKLNIKLPFLEKGFNNKIKILNIFSTNQSSHHLFSNT